MLGSGKQSPCPGTSRILNQRMYFPVAKDISFKNLDHSRYPFHDNLPESHVFLRDIHVIIGMDVCHHILHLNNSADVKSNGCTS